ncbi:MAG: glycine oxidase ThiO [Vicinamibacteraceae bacterium]
MPTPAVVVVGAGLVGSAVAWELASRGAAVSVFDAREPGHGATQASAGMLAPYTEVRASGPFESLCIEGLEVYDEFVARLRRDTDAAFEFTRCGSLELALDDPGRAHLRHEHDRVSAWPAAGAEWLEPAEIAIRQPGLSAAVRGGLLLARQGRVAPADFTSAMVAAARRAGATVTAGAPVSRLARVGGGYEVHAGGSRVRADVVVMSAGSWVGRIDIGEPQAPGVRPIRGQVLLLRPRLPVTSRILWGPRCYLVPRADGCLLVGATVEDVGFDESTTVAGLSGLMQAAIELVPALADAALVEVRAGLRPVTRDELPVIGARAGEPGLVYAAGHYRNGALLAPITARIVADAVLDGRRHPALDALGPDRPTL